MSDAQRDLDLPEPTEEQIRESADISADVPPEQFEAPETVHLEELEPDLSDDIGAQTAMESAQEGEPWFPPTDPVLMPAANNDGAADIRGELAPASDERFREDANDEQGVATDDEIADAVRRVLVSDGSTSGMDVQVLVANGIVTLRGAVDHLEDAEAAQAVAGSVPGVLDVQEELRVGGR